MPKTPLARLRLTGQLEGLSFLLLLFVAMPLKYLAGMPLGVRVVGMAHGVLFLAYLALVFGVALERRWGPVRVGAAVVASVVPFGTLVFDRSLAREELAAATVTA
jgi:integral membrane protein